ncbi:chromosome segregation protein SMC [Brevibacillus sp. HB1.3]|uniref:ATP-binding cassette domain-containing protein n=1 Tax=Brevibacillus sp. HB1.3 TaxID=2738842 RepID=UPI001552C596|nr:ATP-binding cassette domain-containing protein [Brevibacillus sp. HB1.3]NQF15714.1 chromosome segregation protein SMC [Brevibacillus sp. HB1.3]
MIPWRLTFSGVRDYSPTLVDLSGEDHHVLITGPNGAGKSTLTFCMGAVLYSSKVDIEGLKSRNLSTEQTWRARISLLFKNDGLMKIDAPSFIEFTLTITQDPGQPLKKEFSISKGEQMDRWEETVTFTSGDRYFNFSAYRKDLQYKYKIDPDLFYLIWYQQEVNQFAVMHPVERFRIFSEIHGIDKIQRNWEESMEKMKETEDTLRSSELNVKLMKAELSMKKAALDRFLDNQRRLREGGELYIESLFGLEEHFKNEKERVQNIIQQLEEEMEEVYETQALRKEQHEKAKEHLNTLMSESKVLDARIEEAHKKIDEATLHLQDIQIQIEELEKELESITLRKSQIIRTEEEVKAELYGLLNEQKKTNEDYQRTHSLLEERQTAWQEKVVQVAKSEEKIAVDNDLEVVHLEKLQQYKSSHAVQEKITLLEKEIEVNKDNKRNDSLNLRELEEELALLEEERNLSARQLESMKLFRSQQIKAYPLRELIEMDETARLKDEQLFHTIKYTIFVNATHVNPPNDLYHVPLMKIVPDRSVTKLPDLHIRVKEGLREEEIPYAIKALWWVEQFFKDEAYSIQNGVLIDPIGIRGPQEKEKFILSIKALRVRKQEVQEQIETLAQRVSFYEQKILADTKTVQELNSIIHQVREAEAFMTNEHERVLRKEMLIEVLESKEELEQDMKRLDKDKLQLVRLQIKQQKLEEELREEEAVYEELGKMKDKYERLNEFRKQVTVKKEQLKEENSNSAQMERELGQLERKISQTEREIRKLSDDLEKMESDIQSRKKQKENYMGQIETTKQERVETIKELNELQHITPDIYSDVFAKAVLEKSYSISQLRKDRERGQVIFNQARMEEGIDPAAPENHETAKFEYERLADEFKRTSILLEQDRERSEQLRDKLETTINMRVLELQQRFKMYMSHFQFEGDISWESFEDQRKRIHFKLYIKARKEGHRGSLEDVSIKARGGKVGKGVSGGEESLSSLLFALALLQNLQTTPGFIVLDEFDSALDENRKSKVFDLYEQELKRKLIILTPKSHEETYLNRFTKAFIVQHDPTGPTSRVIGIVKGKD